MEKFINDLNQYSLYLLKKIMKNFDCNNVNKLYHYLLIIHINH